MRNNCHKRKKAEGGTRTCTHAFCFFVFAAMIYKNERNVIVMSSLKNEDILQDAGKNRR